MNIETLTCNSCGAPLQVPESANFVTCNHCSTQLAIRRSETATFTEQLDRLAEQTEHLSAKVDRLTVQNELAELDRAWDKERDTFMQTSKDGKRSLPSRGKAVFAGIAASVFGVVWIGIASRMNSVGGPPGGMFQVFGGLIILLGVSSSFWQFAKAGQYEDAERRYRRRRDDLRNQQS